MTDGMDTQAGRPRLLLLGAGRAGTIHARTLTAAGAQIVGVVDDRLSAATALSKETGARPSTSLDEALGLDSFDGAVIALPHHLHRDHAVAAFQAGLHVLLEKPIATSLADADAILEASREANRTLLVAHNLLYHPAIVAARELVDAGYVGAPVLAEAWSGGWLDLAPWDFRLSAEQTGGGAWFDGAPHLIYVLELLAGPIDRILAVGRRRMTRLGAEDAAVATIEFAGGHVGAASVSYSDRGRNWEAGWPAGWRMGFIIRGSEGTITVTTAPEARLVAHGREESIERTYEVEIEDTFVGVADDFVALLCHGRPPRVTPAESVHVLQLTLDALSGAGDALGRFAGAASEDQGL